MADVLSGIDNAPDSPDSGSDSLSLSDIARGFVKQVADSAAQALANKVTQPVRSANTAPAPDLTASAAKGSAASFLTSSVAGVSLPVLILGAAAVLYFYRRR